MALKNVKFDYYQVNCLDIINDKSIEKLFDLEPLLDAAKGLEVIDTTYRYYGEEARLQTVKKHDNGLWEIQFMRIRKNILPGIAKDNGDFNYLDLEEDESVGEEVSMLYDKKRCIAMIQRNRNSLAPSGIMEYFNMVYEEKGLFLKPIPAGDLFKRVKEDGIYTKLNISFADIKPERNINDTSLLKVINLAESYEAYNVQLILSLGKHSKKAKSLNSEKVFNALKDLVTRSREKKDVKKVEISTKQNQDTKVEVFDLIDEKMHDVIPISYSREEPIEHKRVIKYMFDKYSEKESEIDKILGY